MPGIAIPGIFALLLISSWDAGAVHLAHSWSDANVSPFTFFNS